jgi:hypothetical protein
VMMMETLRNWISRMIVLLFNGCITSAVVFFVCCLFLFFRALPWISKHSSVHMVCNNVKYSVIYSATTLFWLLFYVHLCQICGKKGE